MPNEVKVFKPTKVRKKKVGDYGLHKNTTAKTRMLVMDDRLISKQYLKGRIDNRISDASFDTVGDGAWADATDIAPSKNTLNNYLNSLEVSTSAWTQEGTGPTSKTRTYDSGYVGIGSTLHYTNDITEMLTVDGNIKATGDLLLGGGNLTFSTDSAVVTFGADSDTTLTHTDGTGLTLNSTNKLCFNDASQFIQGSSATVLSIGATDEIDLTATEIEINGSADINGTDSHKANIMGTLMTFTLGGNIPMLFQPSKTHEDFAMVKIDQSAITIQQVAPEMYTIGIRLTEVW